MLTSSRLALVVCLFAACGGGSGEPKRYPESSTISWSYSIGPPAVGKPRRMTSPAIGTDGTIYVGGADSDKTQPPVACMFAFAAGGSLKERLCGSEGDHRGAPTLWVAASPSGRGGYGVDEAGGLYAIRPDGASIYRKLPNAPVWGPDPTFAGPVFVSGEEWLYVGGAGIVYAIDIADEHVPVKWSFRAESPNGTSATPIYYAGLGPNGNVYASGRTLYVFNPAGVQLWTAATGGGTEGGPTPGYEGRLIARMHRGIVAVTSAGWVSWKFDPGEQVLGATRLDSRGNVYFSAGSSLHGVNQVGQPQWKVTNSREFTGPPALLGETLFASDAAGDVHAFGLDGQKLWTIGVGKPATTPALEALGTSLYVATDEPRLYALVPPS